jgi:type IV secretory pathway VirB10-like protein
MQTALCRLSAAVLSATVLAVGVSSFLVSADAEARVRVRVRSHTQSSVQTTPPPQQSQTPQPAQPTPTPAVKPTPEQLQRQAAATEARDKRMAEMRARDEEKFAKVRERRDARIKAKRDEAEQKSAEVKAPVVAEAPKAAPAKIVGYRDERGVMQFTDGTDSASQTRPRGR